MNRVERTTRQQSERESRNQNGKSETRKEWEKTSERISVAFQSFLHNKMILSGCNSFTPETRVIEVTLSYAETNI